MPATSLFQSQYKKFSEVMKMNHVPHWFTSTLGWVSSAAPDVHAGSQWRAGLLPWMCPSLSQPPWCHSHPLSETREWPLTQNSWESHEERSPNVSAAVKCMSGGGGGVRGQRSDHKLLSTQRRGRFSASSDSASSDAGDKRLRTGRTLERAKPNPHSSSKC